MNFTAAKDYIVDRMADELPGDLSYHGLHHTLDVVQAATWLADQEGVHGDDRTLLLTAAYYHDAGFLEQYSDNELLAVLLASEVLPRFDYAPAQVTAVADMIMATRIPQKPQSPLARLLCDADLDYLGRPDFVPIANTLREELMEYGQVKSVWEWNQIQERFLSKHRYFTATARATREAPKNQHLAAIRQWLASHPTPDAK